jgi:hypothetical protein
MCRRRHFEDRGSLPCPFHVISEVRDGDATPLGTAYPTSKALYPTLYPTLAVDGRWRVVEIDAITS